VICQAGEYLKAAGLWIYTAIGPGLAVYIRALLAGTAGVAGDLVAECGTYTDVFCGSGRAQMRDTRQLVDGSPIAARKCSRRKAACGRHKGGYPDPKAPASDAAFPKSPRPRQWILPVVPHRNPYSTSIAKPGTSQSFTRSSDSIEPVNTPTSASVAL